MKYYGKSQEVCLQILKQFEQGCVPDAISKIFIHRKDENPSRKWSYRNRFIMAVSGTHDARGFKQWGEAGRKVAKGAKAFHILGPCLGKKKTENGEEETFLYGFKSIPVFSIENTEVVDESKWTACVDTEEEERLKNLPLYEVAQHWGIKVTSYNGEGANYYGYYTGKTIALGVKNVSTWIHELIHAADDKNKTLTKGRGQKQDNEIVAQIGSATLLKMLGYQVEYDPGYTWQYVQSYAKADKSATINICLKLIDRICQCITLILYTQEQIENQTKAD